MSFRFGESKYCEAEDLGPAELEEAADWFEAVHPGHPVTRNLRRCASLARRARTESAALARFVGLASYDVENGCMTPGHMPSLDPAMAAAVGVEVLGSDRALRVTDLLARLRRLEVEAKRLREEFDAGAVP